MPELMLKQAPQRALRVSNVARELGVAPRTVRQWAADGILPAHKRGPKLWFFYERDIAGVVRSDLLARTPANSSRTPKCPCL